jgi:hypothetical protein
MGINRPIFPLARWAPWLVERLMAPMGAQLQTKPEEAIPWQPQLGLGVNNV